MESSTSSSIHKLPENHINGIVGKLNDINDANDIDDINIHFKDINGEIATYARGLENLTEKLQSSTLGDSNMQRSSVEPTQNGTNGFSTDAAAPESNGTIHTNGAGLINGEHNYAANGNGNNLNGDCDGDVCNGNCDVVDSSPNTTIFSDYMNNSSNSMLATDCRESYPTANDMYRSLPYINGCSESCSDDLRGKFGFTARRIHLFSL